MRQVHLPLLASVTGLSCVFVARGADPRPAPEGLLPLLAAGSPGGEGPSGLVTLRQIHSGRCLVVSRPTAPHVVAGDADALATVEAGLALGVATADCVPLVAADPVAGALAVVHAGWRGTLAGVLEATLETLVEALGARADRIAVAAGPSAGPCCYQVGDEVLAHFERDRPPTASRAFTRGEDGKLFLDLVEANRLQALDKGVRAEAFEAGGLCTICRPDLFHSYRRDGATAGRMWLLAALRSEA